MRVGGRSQRPGHWLWLGSVPQGQDEFAGSELQEGAKSQMIQKGRRRARLFCALPVRFLVGASETHVLYNVRIEHRVMTR